MKNNRISGFLLASAFLAAQAGAQTIAFDDLPSVKDIAAGALASDVQVPAPSAPEGKKAPAAPKEWTIMVFMNGKNSLSKYIHTDMNEMEQVGSTDKVNVVVQAARTAAPQGPHYPPPGDYDPIGPWGLNVAQHPGLPAPAPAAEDRAANNSMSWTGVRRYYITKDADTAVTGSTLLEELPKTDMGDWNNLVAFAKWAKTNYPAKKYMLIVWNHGDGWKTRTIGSEHLRAISIDDETGNRITAVQLGQALAQMGGVDIYASDACLMQMAEVVYELKDYAPVIVGSEETEPGDGWNYQAFLSRINPANLTPEAVAVAAVDGYNASYAAKGKGVTISAVRSREAEPLRALMDQWADLAMTQDRTNMKETVIGGLAFSGAESRDLLHLLAVTGAKVPALKAKGAEITALVTRRMIIKNAPYGDAYKNAGGLAIYLPRYDFDDNYAKLSLSKAGKWDEFTRWLMQ